MSSDSTIFAPATASGRAGVAVIRISGPKTDQALARLGVDLPPARVMTRAVLADPQTKESLDDGLVVWFPAPRSFTGEDVAELHLHGGRAVLDGVLTALNSFDGLRPAEPGEFSRRAFEAGKLDLTQAEAIADLVDAETRAQARQALKQMGGGLKSRTDTWRDRLVQALAHLEAVIDFPDEDLPQETADALWKDVAGLDQDIAVHLADEGRAERLRSGVHVAIVGPPNAGKSSLLNLLAQRDAAIVSDTAGTTRDVIDVHLDLDGYPVVVADTAGLREDATEDDIELEGMRRAKQKAGEADLIIALFDGAAHPARDKETDSVISDDSLVVVNKSDLLDQTDMKNVNADNGDNATHFISVKTGFGVEAFLSTLTDRVRVLCDSDVDAPLTRPRHRNALNECRESLARAQRATLPELAAEDLRLALRALGRITGAVDVEELLDVVFKDFCIGK